MAARLGVDFVGLWAGRFWVVVVLLVVAECCGGFGVNARRLIVYDLEWVFKAGIETLVRIAVLDAVDMFVSGVWGDRCCESRDRKRRGGIAV